MTSLSRKPLAPADKAAYTYSSRSNVVKMMIRVPAAPAATICLVASMPSSRGIRMSISTTSGRCWSTAAIACSPSAASASTSTPAAFRMSPKPPRTSAWSSATTVVTGRGLPGPMPPLGTAPPVMTRPPSA